MAFDFGKAIAGAGTGFAMGGPWGALAGGALGGFSGDLTGSTGQTSFKATLDPQVLAQQQAFSQALQAQASGLGPNLAQEQFRQASSSAGQQAAALAASQKGINPALAARQAAQQQASMSQQAAGQSGMLAAQQQLQTQGLLGQQLNQMQNQQLSTQGTQANLAAFNAKQQGAQVGGLMSGLGAAATTFAPTKNAAPTNQISGTPTMTTENLPQLQMPTLAAPAQQYGLGGSYNYAEGGLVNPQSHAVRHVMGMTPVQPQNLANGGNVPGRAQVQGNSLRNDTVAAQLSPGEIVIPRSISMHKDAGELAKRFVEDAIKKKNNTNGTNYYEGGPVGDVPDFLKTNVDYASSDPTLLQKTQQSLAEAIPTAEPSYDQYWKLHNEYPALAEEAAGKGLIPKPPGLLEKTGSYISKLQQEGSQREQQALQAAGVQMPQQQQPQQMQYAQQPTQPIAPTTTVQQPEQQDIYGYGATMAGMQKGIAEQKAGLFGEAAATGELGKQQATAMQNYNNQMIQRQQDFEQNTSDIMNQIKTTTAELRDAKIDPSKYLGEMSTVGKLSTAMGLILGGLGGGMSGTGGNVALDILNKNIDRDILAQKSSIDQKNTLLSGFYKEYGNMKDAEMMTRAVMQDQVSMQLKMLASSAQDPIAKARALQAAGQIDTQQAQAVGTLSARKALASAENTMAPERYLETVRQTNPEQAKNLEARLVPGIGFASIPVPDGVRQKMTARQSLNNTLSQLQQFAKQNQGSLNPTTNAQGESLAKQAWDAYRLSNEMGAFTGDEKQFVEDIIGGSPTKFFAEFRTLPKYKAAQSQNQAILNNMYQSYGLKPKKDLTKFEGKVGQ